MLCVCVCVCVSVCVCVCMCVCVRVCVCLCTIDNIIIDVDRDHSAKYTSSHCLLKKTRSCRVVQECALVQHGTSGEQEK